MPSFAQQKFSNLDELFRCYCMLGCNFEKLEEYDNALKYLLLAKRVLKDLNASNSDIQEQFQNRVSVSVNLSNVYEKKHQYDKSILELQTVLNTEDVACVIDAKHMCVNSRGIKDIESSTVTSEFGGKFKDEKVKREFLDYIKLDTKF